MATELDSREKALKGAQAALVQSEKMAAFGQLGAGIAHEIKNPLAGILGLTQLSLRRATEDDPVYKNLTIIEKETNRCTTIIQNLLKFARQEKVAFEPVNINQVAQDAAAIVEHQLEMHKVKLKKNFASSLPMISGNANQIQQVLVNLMINAQQAMEGSPGEVTVTTLSLDSSHVQVQIRDNGSGIPEDIQAKIFEPFFTTKEVGKGTGLGLSVSYGIIKEHKGEIKVESSPEKGTTFKIEFPLAVLKTACTKCGQTYKIRQEHIGLKNKCKKCKSVFIVEEHT
jgi:signal transduction histidine kinase